MAERPFKRPRQKFLHGAILTVVRIGETLRPPHNVAMKSTQRIYIVYSPPMRGFPFLRSSWRLTRGSQKRAIENLSGLCRAHTGSSATGGLVQTVRPGEALGMLDKVALSIRPGPEASAMRYARRRPRLGLPWAVSSPRLTSTSKGSKRQRVRRHLRVLTGAAV